MFKTSTDRYLVLCLTAIFLLAASAIGMPPHPELIEKINSGKIAVPAFLSSAEKELPNGLNAPSRMNLLKGIVLDDKNAGNDKASAPTDFNILAVLVSFSDNTYSTGASLYDSVLFSAVGNTVRNYYGEISYGQLDLVTVNLPSGTGWQTAPQSYDYYVNDESGISSSSYPNNSQRLVEDLVGLVDPLVNFSNYDNNHDGFVDGLIVIHAGQGAEVTGESSDLWSHKWNTKSPKSTNDGVHVWEYTIQPEYINNPGDMTIGVICHELGHAFGLPDLYDIDNSSYGIGRWGIMSYGSWNGPSGSTPAHPCAWSRIEMGFASVAEITSNVTSRSITEVKNGGDILKLNTSGSGGSEYFLVENRQKVDFDSYLPGSGLLIWHIDDAMSTSDNTDNTDEWWPGLDSTRHLRVALEQADGLFEIEHTNDMGDQADLFINGRMFSALSSTTSDTYTNGPSFVSVTNISDASTNMFADITVGLASSVNSDFNDNYMPVSIELSQNYPNPFNPSTSIEFSSTIGGMAELSVYNLLGQKVKTIVKQYIPAGQYTYEWHGKTDNGENVVSGLYFYKLTIDEFTKIKKMVLLK